MYFTHYKSSLEVSVAFRNFFITKPALTTKIFCIIVTSPVNFEGNTSGGEQHSMQVQQLVHTEQETERCIITSELLPVLIYLGP